MISGKLAGELLRTAALGTLLLLSACGGRPVIGGDPALSVVPTGVLPAPTQRDYQLETSPYFVGPFDRLIIDVYGVKDLTSREVQVDASGQVSFPLVGLLRVSGKTPVEIEQDLVERLRKAYIREPQVTVNLKEVLSRVITVEGEVEKPGLYPLTGRTTLVGAVAKAEGTTEFSKLDEVVVFRTVGGQRYAALYSLEAIRRGAYADPEIYANDVVTVSFSDRRRFFKDLAAVAAPLIILIDRVSR
jgi:polysaccharide export outer membrane protein